MKILVITSCTGEKAHKPENQLTFEDFKKGENHIAKREMELVDYMTSAEQLYTGMQHTRLMRGVNKARETNEIDIDLWVLSAGYGLVPGNKQLAPYECTFTGMKVKEITDWATEIGIPNAIKQLLATEYDLALVLLGDSYLRACGINEDLELGGSALFLTGKMAAKRLPELEILKKVILVDEDTRKFSCGLVGLKGEVVARVLEKVATKKLSTQAVTKDPGKFIAKLGKKVPAKAKRPKARANPKVDHVIKLPNTWWEKPHRKKLRYFIPEWDDLVDPDYDFENDVHSGGTGDWSNQVYAHQMYPEPGYDGILMSRAVAEGSKKKNERINRIGVHRYLRVPREFPIMGDCGAFDYIDQKEPPYSTDDVIDYYSRLDFDFGVSVDHLVVPKFEAEKKFRYELTLNNAEEFIREHRSLGLKWEPIGAVQGWDVNSYVKAAAQQVAMGYQYIALGGLVRTQTPQILEIVRSVRSVIPPETQIHVFGFSRSNGIHELIQAGANSIDSASMLRKAWLGANLNYLTPEGWYAAIRIPQSDKSPRPKRLVKEGVISESKLHKLETTCLKEVRAFAENRVEPSNHLVSHLVEYDTLVAGERKGTEERIRRTLDDRPWEKCGCAICEQSGIEVILFRGNNRNRRRGFHNTHIFHQLMQDIANGRRMAFETKSQLELPIQRTTGS